MSATPTVESLHAQWVAAFNAHDLDRHMALHHEDAMHEGNWRIAQHHGSPRRGAGG